MKNLDYCARIEKDMVILSEGNVSKCCIDFEGLTSFGNVDKGSLSDIWNGAQRMGFIEKLKLHKRKKLYPCNICVI